MTYNTLDNTRNPTAGLLAEAAECQSRRTPLESKGGRLGSSQVGEGLLMYTPSGGAGSFFVAAKVPEMTPKRIARAIVLLVNMVCLLSAHILGVY